MHLFALVPLSLVPLARLPIPGAEIPAFDRPSQRLFVTSAMDVHAFALDASGTPRGLGFARLGEIGDDVTHVAVDPAERGFIAACVVPQRFATRFGRVAFIDPITLQQVGQVNVGHNPDSCVFTPGGEFLIVANEGQAETLPTGEIVDPPGSVTVIDLRRVKHASDLQTLKDADVAELMLHGPALDEALASDNPPRISERNRQTPALDLEPEYVTAPDNQFAYVTLQENNAVLRVGLDPARIDRLTGLGLVDRVIDASDRDGSLAPVWQVSCAPMPDQLATLRSGEAKFLLMAEEGDTRGPATSDGAGIGDEARVADLLSWTPTSSEFVSRADAAPERLGRLNVLVDAARGREGGPGSLVVPGTRSLSVYDATTMARVADTGSAFEIATLSLFADDARSDDRGPEPEGVVVTTIDDQPLAIVSLERPGAIAGVDLRDPAAPALAWVYPSAWDGDRGPEGMCLIEGLGGRTLLVVCFETSGTLVVYEVTSAQTRARNRAKK